MAVAPSRCRWWAASAWMVVVLGLGRAALMADEPGAALRVGLASAVLAGLVSWGLRVDSRRPIPGLFARVVGDGVRWGLLALALHGWVAMIGPWAAALVPWGLCVSPDVRRAVRRLLVRWGLVRSSPLGAETATLSTHDLGRLWCWSAGQLPRASPARRTRLVRLRQGCLDELERRDRRALQTWLNGHPDVDSDPTAHFAPDQ